MLKLRSKYADESGNAIIEFITIGLLAQLVIFGYLVKFGEEFRSELAAQTIGRQALRSLQISDSTDAASAIANQVTSTFGITKSDVNVDFSVNCALEGKLTVKVRVRKSIYETVGFCLK